LAVAPKRPHYGTKQVKKQEGKRNKGKEEGRRARKSWRDGKRLATKNTGAVLEPARG